MNDTVTHPVTQDLQGHVALVTGGSRGLGATLALALARRGADVAISYVNAAEAAHAVVQQLQAQGVRALAIRNDQAEPASATALVDAVLAHFGRLDILVHNAAICVQGVSVDDPSADAAELERMWRTNVHGPLALTRAAAPHLPHGARILFIGSGFGTRVAFPGVADYAATKAALIGYARGAARDLGPRGITVNVLQPGVMPTAMAGPLAVDPPKPLLDLHAITRIATLEEVAAMAVHLVGPQAGYISGTVVDVSGGYTA